MSGIARRATSILVAASFAAALVACGSDTAAPSDTAAISSTTMSDAHQLDGVTGELVITRQRDLIDRGLINVLVRNDSDMSMLLDDIELVADLFSSEPAGPRVISVRSGRRVAVQVPYGMVDDCESDRLVQAELAFSFTGDDDSRSRTARLELDGTDILDTIRTRHCIAREFDAATHTRFEDVSIVDGAVVAELVIEPSGGSASIAVEAVSGTILIGVRAPDGWAGVRLDAGPVAVPLTFSVNRCDPHALAEVTKRYGLDLSVSVDGAEPVPVPVDVAELVTALEAIVEQCVANAAGG